MKRVAVIDDDGCFTQLVSEVLALKGWQTVSCHREGEAMDCVRQAQPDVILLDLHIDSMESGGREKGSHDEGNDCRDRR